MFRNLDTNRVASYIEGMHGFAMASRDFVETLSGAH
jgi:hypothetical protein